MSFFPSMLQKQASPQTKA